MLAYAPRSRRRRINPAALSLIIAFHAVAIAAVMSAKMQLDRQKEPAIVIESLPLPPEPTPDPVERPKTRASDWTVDAPPPLAPSSSLPGPPLLDLPAPPAQGSYSTNNVDSSLLPLPAPVIRTGPRFATPAADVRPPYPESMRARDQESVLRLKLTIDERGRVVAVEPVGKADAMFLATARRHILRAWRYQPAMDGDRAMAASTVITLKFELD